jgi:hypothetical protein
VAHDKLTELDAVAFLFAAPSQMNRHFTDPSQAQLSVAAEKELRDLGVSDQTLAKVLPVLAQLNDDDRRMFRAVGEKLAAMFWDGEVPHPVQPEAKNVVAKMRDAVPA